MQASRTARAALSHAWLFDLLFAGTPAVTWAAAGALPAGFERAEQFAVLRTGAGRSFMVSLGARPGVSSALTSYNALRSGRTRLARRVLGLGLRAGLIQPLLRDKIDIGIAPGTSPARLADELLGELLQRLFGRGPVVVAFGGGSGPYRKPVLQVFASDGAPLGYIKVGWNDWAREAVGREAAALRACALRPMHLGVPEFLGRSTWRGLDLLITGPLPRGIRRLGSGSDLPDASVLREISELAPGSVGELATSPWWLGVRSRIQADGGRSGGPVRPGAGRGPHRAGRMAACRCSSVPGTAISCRGISPGAALASTPGTGRAARRTCRWALTLCTITSRSPSSPSGARWPRRRHWLRDVRAPPSGRSGCRNGRIAWSPVLHLVERPSATRRRAGARVTSMTGSTRR